MNMVLCSIFALILVTGIVKADLTLDPGYIAEIPDKDVIEALVKSVARHEKRIETLEATVVRQNDVIAALQKAQENKDSDEDSDPGSRNVQKIDNKPAVDQAPQQELRQDNAARQGIHQSRRQVSVSPVAFSALTSHSLSHLGAGQNLIFEKTNVNTNNVYNPHHGVFTAPVPGIYLITTSILAQTNQELHCDIVLDGHVVAQIYARGTDGRHDQGSQTILLHLKQGDDVSIQNNDVDDAIYGGLYTTFSGFLLFEEETTSIVG